MKPYFRIDRNEPGKEDDLYILGIRFKWQEFFSLPKRIWSKFMGDKPNEDS